MTPSDSGKGGDVARVEGEPGCGRLVVGGVDVCGISFAQGNAIASRINAHIAAGFVRKEDHCKDCCCARSWKALGITGYTGKDISEHIERIRRVAGEMAAELAIAHNSKNEARCPSCKALGLYEARAKQDTEGRVPPTEKKDLTDSQGRL